MKQFYLANTPTKQVYLKPIIEGKTINFTINKGHCDEAGWVGRGNLVCPVCGNSTEAKILKEQFKRHQSADRMLAVIWDGSDGKLYKLPTKTDFESINTLPKNLRRPSEQMPVQYTQALPSCTWGLSEWGQMFSPRQLHTLQTLVTKLGDIKEELEPEASEYGKAVVTYLGILMDRLAVINTSFGVWHVGRETLERPMGRQAIPMVFDYPESNPFCDSGGSAINQLDWLTRYIESECESPFIAACNNATSGERNQFADKVISAVVTDPPYYDAIAYADLSDFFYVWLKRTISELYPLNFATPQTPKSDECTALKHHHNGKLEKAKQHFESKLLQIFDAIEHQTSDIVSIMFAHQSTEAWTTLCNSILGSRMNITGSWANDTEMTGALKTDKAFLSTSVTVSCRPAQRVGSATYREVKRAIDQRVKTEVEELYKLGFRGPDLLTACFGKAVSEFGRYQKVEKADGSEVLVPELLTMAKESAFNALVKGFEADEHTRFYVAWAQLYGFTETDFDDVNRLVKIGLSIETNSLFQEKLLVKDGNKHFLAGYSQRNQDKAHLGTTVTDSIIDQSHRIMYLFKTNDRKALLQYIAKVANSADSLVWRVLNSLVEVLPVDKHHDDKKVAAELLANKDSLIRESKQNEKTTTQTTLGI